jgi:hypothetical protein
MRRLPEKESSRKNLLHLSQLIVNTTFGCISLFPHMYFQKIHAESPKARALSYCPRASIPKGIMLPSYLVLGSPISPERNCSRVKFIWRTWKSGHTSKDHRKFQNSDAEYKIASWKSYPRELKRLFQVAVETAPESHRLSRMTQCKYGKLWTSERDNVSFNFVVSSYFMRSWTIGCLTAPNEVHCCDSCGIVPATKNTRAYLTILGHERAPSTTDAYSMIAILIGVCIPCW